MTYLELHTKQSIAFHCPGEYIHGGPTPKTCTNSSDCESCWNREITKGVEKKNV